MIRHNKLLIAAGAAALSTGIYSASTNAATDTANALATVIAPLTITTATNLSFGDLVVNGAGTVDVDTSNGRTVSANIDAVGGTVTSASFTVDGEGNKNYIITLPASSTIGNGTDTLTVDGYTSNFGDDGAIRTLDASGTESLIVGATLNFGGTVSEGDYTGTFDVTINYE